VATTAISVDVTFSKTNCRDAMSVMGKWFYKGRSISPLILYKLDLGAN
jgi:hypothetical protein